MNVDIFGILAVDVYLITVLRFLYQGNWHLVRHDLILDSLCSEECIDYINMMFIFQVIL